MSGQIKDTVGLSVSFSKTVSESDVYLFAGITGDFSPNHVDEEFMRSTQYGQRITHGALLVGYMSRASTMFEEQCAAGIPDHYPVSLGYDRIRFLKPVFIGDTITVKYVISSSDELKTRTIADIAMTKAPGDTVAVATHIMQWLPRDLSRSR